MKIVFVRHAEIAGDPFIEPSSPVSGCLSKKGVAQAKAAAKALKDVKFDVAFSSTYGRAMQTAEAIIAGRKLKLKTLPFLVEWLPNRELSKLPSTEFGEIQRRVSECYPEETWKTEMGEGCFDMYARVCPPFLKELDKLGIHSRMGGYVIDKGKEDISILVVAHGGSLGVLLSFMLGLPPFPVSRLSFAHTGAATLNFSDCRGIFHPQLHIPVP